MDEVNKLLTAAHADATAVLGKIETDFNDAKAKLEHAFAVEKAKVEEHIANLVKLIGFDPSTLELTQPADQAAT